MNLWNYIAIIPFFRENWVYLWADRLVAILVTVIVVGLILGDLRNMVAMHRPGSDTADVRRSVIYGHLLPVVIVPIIPLLGGLSLIIVLLAISAVIAVGALIYEGFKKGIFTTQKQWRNASYWWRNLWEILWG